MVFIFKCHFDKFQNQPPGEPREHHLREVLQGRSKSKLKSYYLFCFKSSFGIYFKCHFDKFQNQPPGEPREHHLGEVLQGRSKSKSNITLSFQ